MDSVGMRLETRLLPKCASSTRDAWERTLSRFYLGSGGSAGANSVA